MKPTILGKDFFGVTTTESLLEEPELVYCDPKVVRLKLIHKEGRHLLWKG